MTHEYQRARVTCMKVHIVFACSKAPTDAKDETLADMDCEDESVNGDAYVDTDDYHDPTQMKKQKTQNLNR